MHMIETQDADGVTFYWGKDGGWAKTKADAKRFASEDEAQGWIEHLEGCSFGARIDNAIVIED